jgi:hypothetical protein
MKMVNSGLADDVAGEVNVIKKKHQKCRKMSSGTTIKRSGK